MSTRLREELQALAETQTFSPDPSVWDRGRRARRRTQAARGAVVLAVLAVLVGAGTVATRPSAVGPADDVVPEGAIPSRIAQASGEVLTDLAIGRASVAYVDTDGTPVLVDATTGEAHAVDLPDFPQQEVFPPATNRRGPWLALSPDGRHLAYPTSTLRETDPGTFFVVTVWYRTVDLATGQSELVKPPEGRTPMGLAWTVDGQLVVDGYADVTVRGQEPDTTSWLVDPATSAFTERPVTGVPAPGDGISAVLPVDDTDVTEVPFETLTGTSPGRALPTDLYPEGAHVVPLGWADSSLVVAEVDAPAGSYVEGRHLVLFTSPGRPDSEWTWRILVRDVPGTESMSVAADLVPDLDGTSSQQLTHDFEAPPGDQPRDVSWIIGLGVAAAIAVLLGLRWLLRRLLAQA